MLKPTAAALIVCLPLAAPAHAQAAAGISAASALTAQVAPDPSQPAYSPIDLSAGLDLSEEAQPAPVAQTRHHPLRTLVIVLGIIIAAVLVAAVYLGHHN
jgi:hypothetical protein